MISDADVANRFLHDTALVYLWGGNGFLAFISPADVRRQLGERTRQASSIAVCWVVVTSSLALPISLVGFFETVPGSSEVLAFIFYTAPGNILLLELASALVLLGAYSTGLIKAVTVLAGFLLCERVLAGHAADEGPFLQTIQATHILAGGAWLGALPLYAILVSVSQRHEPHGGAIVAMRRFSQLGHFAVATTLTAGWASALLHSGTPSIAKPYGAAVLLKGAIVTAMALVALVNRYAVLPRLRRSDNAQRLLVANTATEIALGLLALGLVAWFSTINPA